jgi:hypothetical protein
MTILDKLAAQTAHEIVRRATKDNAGTLDTLATNTLGVLQEQGVYASVLFLLSRSREVEKPFALQVLTCWLGLLNNEKLAMLGAGFSEPWVMNTEQVPQHSQELLGHFAENIAGNLHRLIAIKQLFEQTLIYVRYGAKALKVEAEAQTVGGD